MGVTDITKTQTNREGVTLLVSTSQLLVLTDTLQIMAAVDLDIPLVDLKAVDDKIFFLQKNQVWFENFENLKNGILSPILVAGNGQRLDKDGSGKSSSFDDVSSISNYQDTIIVGTETGKVKLISDVASIADFLEKTFNVGVEGFGLHKKAGQRNTDADLDSCGLAHEHLGEYLKKLVENIRASFQYQLPSKLNGPEHSVSAVTVSTVKLASRSFLQIRRRVALIEQDKPQQYYHQGSGALSLIGTQEDDGSNCTGIYSVLAFHCQRDCQVPLHLVVSNVQWV